MRSNELDTLGNMVDRLTRQNRGLLVGWTGFWVTFIVAVLWAVTSLGIDARWTWNLRVWATAFLLLSLASVLWLRKQWPTAHGVARRIDASHYLDNVVVSAWILRERPELCENQVVRNALMNQALPVTDDFRRGFEEREPWLRLSVAFFILTVVLILLIWLLWPYSGLVAAGSGETPSAVQKAAPGNSGPPGGGRSPQVSKPDGTSSEASAPEDGSPAKDEVAGDGSESSSGDGSQRSAGEGSRNGTGDGSGPSSQGGDESDPPPDSTSSAEAPDRQAPEDSEGEGERRRPGNSVKTSSGTAEEGSPSKSIREALKALKEAQEGLRDLAKEYKGIDEGELGPAQKAVEQAIREPSPDQVQEAADALEQASGAAAQKQSATSTMHGSQAAQEVSDQLAQMAEKLRQRANQLASSGSPGADKGGASGEQAAQGTSQQSAQAGGNSQQGGSQPGGRGNSGADQGQQAKTGKGQGQAGETGNTGGGTGGREAGTAPGGSHTGGGELPAPERPQESDNTLTPTMEGEDDAPDEAEETDSGHPERSEEQVLGDAQDPDIILDEVFEKRLEAVRSAGRSSTQSTPPRVISIQKETGI